MDPALGVALLWLLFGGTHVGLATGPVRRRLVTRLGEAGFRQLFSVVASVSFVLLVRYYAAHRFDGPPGLALGQVAGLRWGLMGLIVAGIALLSASGADYTRSPFSLFGTAVEEPRGIARVTRHPMFVGGALLALAHVLLATHLVGTVMWAGTAGLTVLGAWHQDRKMLAKRGAAYADYLAVTSIVPLAAIAQGRQRLVWRELPFGALALGVLLAVWLRTVHDGIFDHGGLWVAVTVIGGGATFTLLSWLRARRTRPALHPRRT